MEILLRKYLWAVDGSDRRAVRGVRRRATATASRRSLASAARRRARPARAAAPAPRPRPLREGGRGDPQAEHLLLDLPADPRRSRSTDTGPPPAPPLQRTSLPLELLAIDVRAAARRSALVGRDHPRHRGPDARGRTRRLEAARRDHRRHRRDRVYLDFGNGRIEYLDLLDRPAAAPRRRAGARPRRRRPAIRSRPSSTAASRRSASTTTRCSASTRGFAAGQHGRASQGGAHRARDRATASRPASASSASGPTARSRRSACRTATSSRRSTASR